MTQELSIVTKNQTGYLATTEPLEDTEGVLSLLIKNVSEGSQELYLNDARQFLSWLAENNISLGAVTYSVALDYKKHLEIRNITKATAARKFTVASRVLDMAVEAGYLATNPAKRVKNFKNASNQETTHRAITLKEAKELLAKIDINTVKGKRDYALILLLLRTGIRRAECAALTLGDIQQSQGHSIAVIQHGKGDKRRTVKIPVDVLRAISDYLDAAERKQEAYTAPLFVSFRKGNHPGNTAMTADNIEKLVKAYAKQANLEGLTPHGLRASFVTLAIEGGAKLQQVQYAAGHADPRTTERYQKRKVNLDDNAVDYIKL